MARPKSPKCPACVFSAELARIGAIRAPAGPTKAPARKPFKDPAKFPVVETAEGRVRLERLRWLTSFRQSVRAGDKAISDAYEQEVAERNRIEHPVQPRDPGVAPRPIEVPRPLRDKREALAFAQLLTANAAEALARAEAMPETDAANRARHQAKEAATWNV